MIKFSQTLLLRHAQSLRWGHRVNNILSVLVYTWKSSICACFWRTLILLTCPLVSVAVLHVHVVLNSTSHEVNSTMQYPRRFKQQYSVSWNQPVKSEGTRYFFLSKSPILALGAFSTMTYKMTETTKSSRYMYTCTSGM